MQIKYRIKTCPSCGWYKPPKGASSHKCLFKGVVFIGESDIKCKHHIALDNTFV